MNPSLFHRLVLSFALLYATLFPLARLQSRARAFERAGHSRVQPRQLPRSAAGRRGSAGADINYLARETSVSLSGDGLVAALVELRAGGPRRRRRGGPEGDSGPAAGRRRDHPVPRRHADRRDGKLQPARSGIGLTVIKSDAIVVPVRVFGTFEAYGRHMRISPAAPRGGEIRRADAFEPPCAPRRRPVPSRG